MNAIGNLLILKLTVLVLTSVIVDADECSKVCGTIAPNTTHRDRRCPVEGFTRNISHRIDWSDGSHSEYNVGLMTQLVLGSCCSNIIYPQYATGIVTDGRFSGQQITFAVTLRDQRAEYNNGCETNSGMSSLTGTILLSIGTKGVGLWIECSGTYNVLFSPPLASNSPQLVYDTASAQLSDCRNCVESC